MLSRLRVRVLGLARPRHVAGPDLANARVRAGDRLLIAAGSMAMPLLPFVVASILGRGGRFFLVGWLMGRFGPAMEPKLRPFMEWLGWGTVALAALVYAYFQLR